MTSPRLLDALTAFEPDPLETTWHEATLDARSAWERWKREPSADAYVVYRAFADQADAAQDALAARARV
jgi:hypothetical protein